MTVKSKASVKADFRTLSKPTETEYVDLIDSIYTGEIGEAIVSAAAVSAGLIEVTNASSVSLTPSGSAGQSLIAIETAASVRTEVSAQEDVITTQGDIIVGNGQASRLAIGVSGQQVAVSGLAAKFKTPPVTVSAATTAETIDGSATNLYVSPGVFNQHRGAAKAWARWGVNGTASAAYNIDSVSDLGVGFYAVNFNTTAATFVNTNYCPQYSFVETFSDPPASHYVRQLATTSSRVQIVSAAIPNNPAFAFAIVYGSVSVT